MKVCINGKDHEFDSPTNLQSVIQRICKDQQHVIAELNEKIVNSEKWNEVQVCEGDRLELVNFVGGG